MKTRFHFSRLSGASLSCQSISSLRKVDFTEWQNSTGTCLSAEQNQPCSTIQTRNS
ncbi:hypothetical protein CHELA40_11137 [Chelatococcus asaccharovorans]|nr:hypothetical protein CHELA40_11137 [Chelatococcus asaccharovorans]CAH1685349.1 hypothetical protein CHELA17_64462 [Chelatococcus asaccharovorans]